MWFIGLIALLLIVLFIHYVNEQKTIRELILYSVLSLVGITQLVLYYFEMPISLTSIIAAIIDSIS